MPLFSYTDVPAFAAKYHQGDRTAAVEALLRNGPNVRYVPNNAYADAKLIVAWWVAALRHGPPSGMAVHAVSPGAATDTKVVRNAGPALKYLFIPIVNLIPGMNQTPETAARRYLQASESEPTSQVNSSPRLKGSSQAQLRRTPPTPPRSPQPRSRVAGRRQCLRRRLVLASILESDVLKERRSQRNGCGDPNQHAIAALRARPRVLRYFK